MAEFIRKHRAAELDDGLHLRALDVLEQKWPVRDERDLRRQFSDDADSGATKASRLTKFILAIGIQPFEAPAPLPPIELDDIHLVCWLAVTPE